MPNFSENLTNCEKRYVPNSAGELLSSAWSNVSPAREPILRRLISIVDSRLLKIAKQNGLWTDYNPSRAEEFATWVSQQRAAYTQDQSAAACQDPKLNSIRNAIAEITTSSNVVRFVLNQGGKKTTTVQINFHPTLKLISAHDSEIRAILPEWLAVQNSAEKLLSAKQTIPLPGKRLPNDYFFATVITNQIKSMVQESSTTDRTILALEEIDYFSSSLDARTFFSLITQLRNDLIQFLQKCEKYPALAFSSKLSTKTSSMKNVPDNSTFPDHQHPALATPPSKQV